MFAAKRIKKDLRELIKTPLPGISLEPTEDDLLNLHFTVIGPEGSKYQGIPFHGSLEIPENYPNTAPKVYYHHYVPVGYGSSWNTDERGFYSICMNINSNWESYHSEWKSTANDGWGPGNSLSTVLIQIQSAFFDTELFHMREIKTLEHALNFKCKVCHHDGSDPQFYQPEILNPFSFSYLIELPKDHKKTIKSNEEGQEKEEKEDKEEKEEKGEKKEKKKNSFLIEIIDQVKNKELSRFDPMDPICFVTKERLSHSEEDSIYGVGLGDPIVNMNNEIYQFTNFEFEYLSSQAWNQGVNRSSTKKLITCWFPLYFNQTHWIIARPKFESIINNFFNNFEKINFKFSNNQKLKTKSVGVKFFFLLHQYIFHYIDEIKSFERFESKLICCYQLLQTIYQYKNDPDLVLELDRIENQLVKNSKMNMVSVCRSLNLYMLFLILRPEKSSSLFESILNEIIYHNQDIYKSRHPDILDLNGSVKNRNEKIFICLKDMATLSRYLRTIRLIRAEFDYNQSLNSKQLEKYLTLDRESFKITSFSDFFAELGQKFDPQLFEQRIVSVLKRPIATPKKIALYQYHHLKIKTRRTKHFARKERRQKKAAQN